MTKNRSAPEAPLVPVLIYEDVSAAIDWLCGAFGFTERLRAPAPDGAISHAQLLAAGGAVFLGRQGQHYKLPASGTVNQYVIVHVEDVDRHFARARAYGARIVTEPQDQPFGERQYSAEDIGGHQWTFSQSVADVDPRTWGAIPAVPPG